MTVKEFHALQVGDRVKVKRKCGFQDYCVISGVVERIVFHTSKVSGRNRLISRITAKTKYGIIFLSHQSVELDKRKVR